MGINIGNFTADLERFVQRCGDQAEVEIGKVALQKFSEIVIGTPVDTGYARATWQIGLNKPNHTLPNKANYKDNIKGTAQDPALIAEAINRGLSQLADFNLMQHSTIYISSACGYMHRLEEGHSDQNSGFIKAAIEHMHQLNSSVEV